MPLLNDNTTCSSKIHVISIILSFGTVFKGQTKPSDFFGVRCFAWVAGNGYFCQGGTPFPAHLSDKYRLPTSKYLRGGVPVQQG